MEPLSLRQKLHFAREASRGGMASFDALCEEHGLDSEELALWLDAYEAGGESGLRVTEMEGAEAPEEIMRAAVRDLRKGLSRIYPTRLFEIGRAGNAITVSVWDTRFDGGDALRPVFQFRRVTPAHGKRGFWVLYWQRVNRKWWPYRTSKRLTEIAQILREVQEDRDGCFWT
jgi:hypothetical protein